jgi:DNA-binding MarR family transcriptional regulator
VDDLRDGIAAAVRRFIGDAVLHNHAVAQEVGLGASDAQFVGLLGQHGPLTPGRLAALSGLTTGTVTGVVDRLERAGFVTRRRDTGDRRKVLVVLEPAAMATLAEHYREHGEHLDRVLAARTPEELRTIAAFLDDLLGPAGRAD